MYYVVAAAGIGLLGSYIGSQGSKSAARTQAQAAEQAGYQQLALGREQLEATRPLRELALEQARFQFGQQKQLSPAFTQATLGVLPLLTQDVSRSPGTSQFFQRALGQQTRNIMSNLAPYGLADSSVTGRAIGEATAGLTAQDIENVRNDRFRLAGFAPSTPSFFGGGTAGLNTAAQLQQGGIQSQFAAGQSLAAGQLGSANTWAQGLGMLGGYGMQGGFNNLFSSGTGQPLTGGLGQGYTFGQPIAAGR